MRISHRSIGEDQPPFVIAELSANHNESLDRALLIVAAAARAGVDAIKLQTYTADTMTLNLDKGEFLVTDPESLWYGSTLYSLYEKAHTPWEWHQQIFDYARSLGLLAFSTPFDISAVDFLETLDVPCYKIASFEITDLPLIRRVAETQKPIIMSTGMASLCEIHEAVSTARGAGCKELALLKCTSAYPASPSSANLLTIPHMKAIFDCDVGISDHTMGIGVSVASVALGVRIIEKHLTLDRSMGGVDGTFSMEPEEIEALVIGTKQAWSALGEVHFGPTETETASLNFRRSLYFVKNVTAGEVITADKVRSIRPGKGLPPKHLDLLLGRVAKRDIVRGTPVSWGAIL